MQEGRLLAVLHERLGEQAWEVPGGHLDDGETFEEAAARETLEETGIVVEVRDLMATCVHEWAERRQRRLIMFFHAVPVRVAQPRPGDADIVRAEWVDPSQLTPASTSAFLHPLLHGIGSSSGDPQPPIMFRAEHRQDAAGSWRPHIVSNVARSRI